MTDVGDFDQSENTTVCPKYGFWDGNSNVLILNPNRVVSHFKVIDNRIIMATEVLLNPNKIMASCGLVFQP